MSDKFIRSRHPRTQIERIIGLDDHEALESMLRDGNVDINEISQRTGDTPLVCAIKHHSFRICQLLLACKGINPNVVDHRGHTPLHHAQALSRDSVGFMKILLEHGADPEMTYDETGNSLLHLAVIGHGSDGKRLISPNNLRSEVTANEHVITPNQDQVYLLMEFRANVNACNTNLATPLHIAARANNLTVVDLLFVNGTDLEAPNIVGGSPLHNACREGTARIVEYLIHKGSSMCARTVDGDTPLHQAIRANNLDTIAVLIKAGADTRVKNNWGYIPGKQKCLPETKVFLARQIDDAKICAVEDELAAMRVHPTPLTEKERRIANILRMMMGTDEPNPDETNFLMPAYADVWRKMQQGST